MVDVVLVVAVQLLGDVDRLHVAGLDGVGPLEAAGELEAGGPQPRLLRGHGGGVVVLHVLDAAVHGRLVFPPNFSQG